MSCALGQWPYIPNFIPTFPHPGSCMFGAFWRCGDQGHRCPKSAAEADRRLGEWIADAKKRAAGPAREHREWPK